MKRFFAASMLSVSICMSQAECAWANTYNNMPSKMGSEEAGVGPQNGIVVGVVAGIIAAIIYDHLLPYVLDELSGNDDEDMHEACDFYEKYRKYYDIWESEYMGRLGDLIWDSGKCDYLFDKYGNDFDEKNQCYVQRPWTGPIYEYSLCTFD